LQPKGFKEGKHKVTEGTEGVDDFLKTLCSVRHGVSKRAQKPKGRASNGLDFRLVQADPGGIIRGCFCSKLADRLTSEPKSSYA